MSELPVIDATLLAIEEVNKRGGLLGKIIEPIIVDGASDPATFASLAEQLIVEKKRRCDIWVLEFFLSKSGTAGCRKI